MLKLASNEEACLVKCGREYWVITKDWAISCYEEQQEEYRATQALADFQREYGNHLDP